MPNPIQGLLEVGNINLYSRPRIKNPDNSTSTLFSMSGQDDSGREVLFPGVSNTRQLTPNEAWRQYSQTGQHLGKFDTPEHATAYAQALHERAEQG